MESQLRPLNDNTGSEKIPELQNSNFEPGSTYVYTLEG